MAWLAAVYTTGLVVWNALRLTPVARWAPFEVADLFGWLLFVPGPVIAFAALLRRRWIALAVLCLPALVFAVEYGPQFLPHRVPSGEPIRFFTTNVYSRNVAFDAVEAAIRRTDADVVAIQELDAGMSVRLSARLRDRFPHQALYPARSSEGLGVLSRYPIVGEDPPERTAQSCRCHVVRLDVRGRQVLVLNAHPHRPGLSRYGFRTAHQAAAVEELLEIVRGARFPAVLLGDLNIADRHALFRQLRRQLGDAHRDAGWGLGLTWAIRPGWEVVRIDHVLHDDRWATRRASTAAMPGSDHRSVAADLVLRSATDRR